MAKKRMFSLDVVDTDSFLDMPPSTQNLYFHFGMRADDDGFVSSPRKITVLVNSSEDDLKLLITKGFIIYFNSGVIVIKDWLVNNNKIQGDRYSKTRYANEFEKLKLENGVYLYNGESVTTCIQYVNEMETNCIQPVNTDKNRLDKSRVDKNNTYIVEILDYLNKKINSNYKTTTNKTKELINARLNEGFTIEDFKTVIDKKSNEWIGTEWEKYLRPNTLFGTKFESYLNQVNISSKEDVSFMDLDFNKQSNVFNNNFDECEVIE